MTLLITFFLIATVIKIATDNAANVLIAIGFKTAKKYKLVIALLMTAAGVFGLNFGVLEALKIPLEVSRSWFHYFDLVVTTFFLTGGAQAIHKLNDPWVSYKGNEVVKDDK